MRPKKYNGIPPDQRIMVRTEDLMALCSCGKATAIQIGNAAKAGMKVGKCVFWNVEKVKAYLDKCLDET